MRLPETLYTAARCCVRSPKTPKGKTMKAPATISGEGESGNPTTSRSPVIARCLSLWVLATLLYAVYPANSQAQGALTGGANHDGTIAPIGDADSWTFTANTGDSIVLGVGTLSSTNFFEPWIQLYGPDGTPLMVRVPITRLLKFPGNQPMTAPTPAGEMIPDGSMMA